VGSNGLTGDASLLCERWQAHSSDRGAEPARPQAPAFPALGHATKSLVGALLVEQVRLWLFRRKVIGGIVASLMRLGENFSCR
jgi:hypothetical protein